jgi:succinate dehydrogenase / fumarate reductase cytochrome b subunit
MIRPQQEIIMTAAKRPLSPHLQVWKWTLTMAMSILNRATGVANAVGLIALVWWLMAAASGPECYAKFMTFATSPLGLFMFIGWTFSLYLHMLGGIRHLIMDTGRLLTIKTADQSVIFILVASVVLTAVTWLTILGS